MKLINLLAMLILIIAPAAYGQQKTAQSNQDQEAMLRERAREFIAARQARNGAKARLYCNPEEIKKIHNDLKLIYASTKDGMQKGLFKKSEVKSSIESGDFADPYKKALLHHLIDGADFDKEMDQAFTEYIITFPFKIVKFDFKKAVFLPDGKTAETHFLEYRLSEGQKQPQAVNTVYLWQLYKNVWYLKIDRPLHL